MKAVVRSVAINAFSLFVASQILYGVKISGGLPTLIFGGLILSVISFIVRPVLNILTLPFNMFTFGAFSFLINAFLLYLLTMFILQITILPFVFPGASFAGFIIPKVAFNAFFAYIAAAFVLSCIASTITWLFKK